MRGLRGMAWLLVGCAFAGCGGDDETRHEPRTVTDEAFAEGRVLEMPGAGPFPRLGLQWTYAVTHEGWPADEHVPSRIAYRLTRRDAMGHPWSGWWIYGTPPDGVPLRAEETGATIEDDHVYFHPPREYALRALEWAPWPIARPGRPGKTGSILTLGKGWENEGERIEKTYEDVGAVAVAVAGHAHDDVWLVKGSSKGWTGRFWWAPRVGWLRMAFLAEDGRRLSLELTDIRLVQPNH